MLQRTVRSDPPDTSEDTIEGALQQIGPPSVRQPSPSAKNVWPHWFSSLLPFNQIGFPMMKNPDQIAQAGKDTIDALTKSSAALTEGYGEISRHLIEQTHKSVATHMTNGKEIFDIKTPGDWLTFQSKWVSDWTTFTVTQMTHFSQLSTKVINQTCEPLKTHFSATFGKMGGFI